MNPMRATSVLNLSKVTATHCHAIKSALIGDVYTANTIINGYKTCKEMDIALKLFDEMPQRDSASWNTMIAACVSSSDFLSAWELFKWMKFYGFAFDAYTFGSILKGAAVDAFHGGISVGKQVHSDVVKYGYSGNVYAGSALLDMYAKSGNVVDAHRVLEFLPERNSVSWNALIAGYADIGDRERCFQFLKRMEYEGVSLEDGTFAPLLTLLDDSEFLKLTMQVHGKVMKLGLGFRNTVLNALLASYSGCGDLESAEGVFNAALGYRDLVTWNSLLAAYLEHRQEELAFVIFVEMEQLGLELDLYTYTSIISACSVDGTSSQGKSLHALVLKRGLEQITSVSNSLIAMYLKSNCRDVEDTVNVFNHTEIKDCVSWNSILTGLSQKGLSEDALHIFLKMQFENMEIDHYTLSAVLRSSSDLASLQLGQQVHVFTVKSGFERNEYVTSALIYMYSKSGSLDDAWKSFTTSSHNSSITWNSIMFAYAQHGQGEITLELFSRMTEEDQVKPDHISFVAIITACSHVGLIDEGKKFLESMEPMYGIAPRMEHYACAIDLLGRAGRVAEAEALYREMPFRPDAMVLKTLLAVCRKCGDMEMAIEAARCLLELEPGEHCTYILLSEMYGQFQKWDEIATVRKLMRARGVKKVPGWSWMEVEHEVHSFNAEDHSHPRCHEIYRILRQLTCEMEDVRKTLSSTEDFDEVVCYY